MPIDTDLTHMHSRLAQYKRYYQKWRDDAQQAEDYYQAAFPISKPRDTFAFLPPTAKTAIELASVELLTDNPLVTRHRRDKTAREIEDDNRIEKAVQAFLLDMEEYQPTPVLHEVVKLLFRRGVAIIGGPFFNYDEWKRSTQGVWFEAYDPMATYMAPGPEPTEAFVVMTMTEEELEQRAHIHGWDYEVHRSKLGIRRYSPLSEVNVVQWYSYEQGKGQKAAWVENDTEFMLDPKPSGYPYLPFERVASGWGSRIPGAKPEEMYVGLLDRGIRNVLRAEGELLTIVMSHSRQGVWNRYSLPPGVVLAEDFEMSTEPNSIITNVPPEMKELALTPLSPEVTATLERVRGMLQETLYHPILSGMPLPGVRTATGLAMLTGRARKRFYPPMRLLQAGVSRVLAKLLKLTYRLGERVDPVFVWRGNPLSAKMLHNDLTLEINLLADDDEERRMKITEGVALEGKVPQRLIWEDYYGIEDYSATLEDWMLDKILTSPEFLQSITAAFTGQLQAAQSDQQQRAQREAQHNAPGTTSGLQRLATAFAAARAGGQPGAALNQNQYGMTPLPNALSYAPQGMGRQA